VNKVLYNNLDYYCTVSSKGKFIEKNSEYGIEISHSEYNNLSDLTIELKSDKWKILWPNREGEIFEASQVIKTIQKYHMPNGLTISYPATASCRTLIFMEEDGRGLAFLAPPDAEGRVTEFRVYAEDHRHVFIQIKGKSSIWNSILFDNINDLENKIIKLKETSIWKSLPLVTNNSEYQVQVGLIGPNGKFEIPEDRGFDVLVDISELMQKKLGKGNILHVFGYASGHDTGYPDYSPSVPLGGRKALTKTIEKIHKNGQKAVFYMNGRIAQKEKVEKKSLKNSVLHDYKGDAFLEYYEGRSFYVMDPSSREWQDRLFSEAMILKELGADGIQLDQLGGRAALVKPGEIWGDGYIQLIDRIHQEGLTVWIQGLSDIYPADWFELTFRNTDILEDGTIRGGTPFGKPDRRLFQLTVPNQVLLIPLSKLESSKALQNRNTIIDLDVKKGELFLYSPSSMVQLEKLIQRVVLN
jgi:hypothetical protein